MGTSKKIRIIIILTRIILVGFTLLYHKIFIWSIKAKKGEVKL